MEEEDGSNKTFVVEKDELLTIINQLSSSNAFQDVFFFFFSYSPTDVFINA